MVHSTRANRARRSFASRLIALRRRSGSDWCAPKRIVCRAIWPWCTTISNWWVKPSRYAEPFENLFASIEHLHRFEQLHIAEAIPMAHIRAFLADAAQALPPSSAFNSSASSSTGLHADVNQTPVDKFAKIDTKARHAKRIKDIIPEITFPMLLTENQKTLLHEPPSDVQRPTEGVRFDRQKNPGVFAIQPNGVTGQVYAQVTLQPSALEWANKSLSPADQERLVSQVRVALTQSASEGQRYQIQYDIDPDSQEKTPSKELLMSVLSKTKSKGSK